MALVVVVAVVATVMVAVMAAGLVGSSCTRARVWAVVMEVALALA